MDKIRWSDVANMQQASTSNEIQSNVTCHQAKMTSTKIEMKTEWINSESFELRWANLSHSYASSGRNKNGHEKNVALQPCYGRVESSTVTAILGPSGAGKSTLLNCITGRIKPDSGRCVISAPLHLIPELKKSRVDYIPQSNEFFTLFTVKETLLFASRMNNAGLTKEEHLNNIERLLQALDISEKTDWPLFKLSGGQMKRVAIACGLITRPAVIVLDEPTSGLDADNAERLIVHLKSLVKSRYLRLKPAVLLTIHSPSAVIFQMFDQVYIMSRGGHNIYQGPPAEAVDHFQSFGFSHPRGNPADWSMEVANGKFGHEKLSLMADANRSIARCKDYCDSEIDVSAMKKQNVSMFSQIWLLIWRSLVYYSVKLPQVEVRMICHTTVVLTFLFLQKKNIMIEPLCSDETTGLGSDFLKDTAIATMKVGAEFKHTFTDMASIAAYCASYISNVSYISIVTAVMVVTLHRSIYHREMKNSWYTRTSYFYAKFLTDTILRVMAIGACGLATYVGTHDTVAAWRVIIYSSYGFMLATIWENIATAMTIFCDKRTVMEVMGLLLILEVIDASLIDLIAPQNLVGDWALFAKRVGPRGNAFGAMLLIFYGFGRCEQSSTGLSDKVSLNNYENPREMMSHLWHAFNVTEERAVNLLDLYDVEEEVSAGLYHSLSAWTSNSTQAHHEHASKTLEFFGYNEPDIVYQTFVVVTWVIATSLLVACAVKNKFK